MSDATITYTGGAIAATATTEYRAERPARTIAHPILGSENVDYTFRPFGKRSGSFKLVFADAATADAALAALSVPRVFALASVSRPGINMSFVIINGTAPSLEPGSAGETLVYVPFQEVTA